MKMLITSIILVLFAVGPVMADENYIGFGVGLVHPADLESEDKTADSDIVLSDLDLDSGFAWALRFGHIIEKENANIAIELEGMAIHGTNVRNQYYYSVDPDINIQGNVSAKTLMFNILAGPRYENIWIYGGPGFGWAWFDMDDIYLILPEGWVWIPDNNRSYRIGNADDECFGWQLNLGLMADIAENVSLGVRYAFFHAEPRFSKGADFDVKTTYEAHIVTVGFNFYF